MIVYNDILSGDEILSDSFPMKEVDGVVYECDCKMVTQQLGAQVDIGANASAEEPSEDLNDEAITVNNVIHSFRLQKTTFDKKSYFAYLKTYMKNVKAKMMTNGADEATIADFEKKASAFAKKIASNFKDYEFYVGESMNVDGMAVLLNYRDDGITPYVTVWKHGLSEQKV
ncbi:Translationally-controlled tumor protein-like protein [Erysiphe neolycopersici]|uniref:Translationally-controlled tumor protein homolog n=1 Tax=Erysiphe neolycopersici TaxID=212602 RepID=A0A420I2Z1_9PEZI|nr:Translationally-controlled tumor protein-like protein [Erysiphe neolycopersici]